MRASRWVACSVVDLLVIGYGNDLRGDDRAGRLVADAVAEACSSRGIDGVLTKSVTQLTPELALDISEATVVVFVDAAIDRDGVGVVAVQAVPGGGVITHHLEPSGLLALAREMGSQPQRAFAVAIPASDFGLGFELSETTRQAVAEATELIVSRWSRSPRSSTCR